MRMNDEKNENSESPGTTSDFEFLQEKIKERPVNKKRLLKRTIITASMAVLFGLLACLSFLLLEPVLNNWLYPEEEPEIVTFPQEQDEMRPEDMLTEGTASGQEESAESEAEEWDSSSHSSTEGQGAETGTDDGSGPTDADPQQTETKERVWQYGTGKGWGSRDGSA